MKCQEIAYLLRMCGVKLRFAIEKNGVFSCLILFPRGANVVQPKRKTLSELFLRGFQVPRAGVEPARVAPLVFETSASTDSAIWAFHLRSPRGFLRFATQRL